MTTCFAGTDFEPVPSPVAAPLHAPVAPDASVLSHVGCFGDTQADYILTDKPSSCSRTNDVPGRGYFFYFSSKVLILL